MYLPYFNLREPPFNLTPDPRFLYLSAQHEEALSHLLYGINERKGFIEITGEVGTGKTLLCRALLEQLDDSISTALVFNSYLSQRELLQAICRDFGLRAEADTPAGLIDRLNAYLLSEFGFGRNAVVVIDEAQNLEPAVLEQLRLLSNLETTSGKLLQIVLVGQPELRAKLSLPGMRQLNQRIAVRFHLTALSRADASGYVMHRLRIAGAGGHIHFTTGAMRRVYRYSGGLPRRVNLLCDRALLTAFVQETRQVDGTVVRRSARDLEGAGNTAVGRRQPTRLLGRMALAGLGACALLGLATSAWLLAAAPGGAAPRDAAPQRTGPPVAAASDTRTVEAAPTPSPGEAQSEPHPEAKAPAAAAEPAPQVRSELLRTLWQVKAQAEAALPGSGELYAADWDSLLRSTGGGLDVMSFQPRLAQLPRISRPCFLEVLPHAAAERPELWLLAHGLPDGVLVYRGPGELMPVPLSKLRRVWYGTLYLTSGANALAGAALAPGARGERVRDLQQALAQGGYLAAKPSGLFDTPTHEAVKQFQRDNWLPVSGNAGRQTLITLLHFGGDALEGTS
ncbi:MAG: AAA family ATPase [Candidatus Tectomicrobia bacterium]|nr:AAA family ATPase [Candidatus Tectomicrobia bacterium]